MKRKRRSKTIDKNRGTMGFQHEFKNLVFDAAKHVFAKKDCILHV